MAKDGLMLFDGKSYTIRCQEGSHVWIDTSAGRTFARKDCTAQAGADPIPACP